ncbi:hypothetical protein [Cryptosporangium aurantiacum]|uniref:Uncharacterized protein n=1 Tax=Cryptosporangium aurantiacum TaxID=134849 RepID=A0A1M7R7N9_9ACTN|nr:hypothetical protein [Cryptosporangium aurantiacum]SHN42162.1 hypothetical protein SAMN05443668_108102 [Cryptosporangium aurantiacum]
MSNPGYGNQGSPYSSDPQWNGSSPYQPAQPEQQPAPASDPWAQPAASPYPATPGSGSEYAAPVSGAEYTVPSYSSPPEVAPPSGPPASAPPASVPPASGPPTSVPPAGYGAPGYGPAPTGPIPTGPIPGVHQTAPIPGGEVGPSAYGQQPGAPKKNRLVIVLGAATAVLLVLGLTMSGLFIAKNGEQNDTQARLTAAEDTIAARDSKISTLEKDLTDTKTKLTNTEQQLDGTKDSLGTANADKQVIAQCLKLVIEALDAIGKGDQAKTDQLIKQLDAPCTKAEGLI